MADPVDISELTSEGIGKGVGAGVTTGVITGGGGGGGGGGATWARADVDAAARASPKTIVAAVMGLRPTPQRSLARENHDEQRMNAFPKTERQLDKKCKKIAVGRADLPPIFLERQSVVIPASGRFAGYCCSAATGADGPAPSLI